MARINLKSSIGRKKEIVSVLTSLATRMGINACIEDENGKIVWGSAQEEPESVIPLIIEDETVGFIKGDAQAAILAEVSLLFLNKEAEKKKLGGEVLHLYQEVNLIFDFSDKLAHTIDAKDIAATTLLEAGRVIRSNGGVILLWDYRKGKLHVMASSGKRFFNEEMLLTEFPFLKNIISNGLSEIITDTSSLINAGIVMPETKSLIYSALKVNQRVMGAVILASNDEVQYAAADLKLLTTLALQSSAAIESALLYEKNIAEALEREEALRRVYEATSKFVPFEFIRSLGHKVITDVRLGDQVEKVVTVLFSDIREYTSIAEQMTPAENFSFVCSFNERVGPFIRKYNGFVNQYLGDSIMAIFPGNAADALAAAIEIQKEVEEFNETRRQNNQPRIRIGIGMHTGRLIMGITGDKERMDACTISDAVNTASRIEGLTKYYNADIILSDTSIEQIIDTSSFHLRSLGLVQLKGKAEPTGIYECFSGNSDKSIEGKNNTLSLFNEAIAHYTEQSFNKANELFLKIAAANPSDSTVQFFMERIVQSIGKTGIVEMQEK